MGISERQSNETVVVAENVTFDEYLRQFMDEKAEWVNGRVIKLAAATVRHNALVNFIRAILDTYCDKSDSGKVLGETFTMRFRDQRVAREPDIMVVTKAHLERLKDTYVEGAADLVVEVLSPESKERDTVEKFTEYANAGVGEYWVIDPNSQETAFYILNDDGEFEVRQPDAEGNYHCAVLPGLHFAVEWFDRRPTPVVWQAVALVDELLGEG
jgi:Uma2 family endonuclease